MDDRRPSHGEREAALHQAATSFLAQRGWSLLTASEMVVSSTPLLEDGTFADPDTAVTHVYTLALYHACAGTDGPAKRETGYDELFRYVYDLARHMARDLSSEDQEDLAREVVADIFYRLSAPDDRHTPVRKPGAFLAIAIQHTRNALRRWRRMPFASGAPDDLLPAEEQEQPEARAEERDLRTRIKQGFARAVQRYPRARTQLVALWMHDVEDIDYETIAEQLQLAVPNVRVLVSRGRGRLHDDPELRGLAQELGLLEEPTYHEPQRTRLVRMKGA